MVVPLAVPLRIHERVRRLDECQVVTGGLDKTIKLLTFNPDGQPVGDPKEFKMTLQCQGMKIDGVIRDKIEGKKLRELIEKASR